MVVRAQVAGNLFVGSLQPAIQAQILEASEQVVLAVRDPVNVRGEPVSHVYFPTGGIISNVLTMNDGSQIEVGIIGREGMAGAALALTGAAAANDLYAQVAGPSLRILRSAFVEIAGQSLAPKSPIVAYIEAQTSALSQYAACNRLHTLEQRFARWLVMVHDRIDGDDVSLTHEFLALMLGVRRAGVTAAASALQRVGVVSYSRGAISIRDRAGLQRVACECYDSVEDRFEMLMGYAIRKARKNPQS
jgi:CRP-like cAMP-binding protein